MNIAEPKILINHHVRKYFANAMSMDLPARQKYFHHLFPFAESLPINFYLSASDSMNIMCNQTTLITMRDTGIKEYSGTSIWDYYEQKKLPRVMAQEQDSNNRRSIMEGGNIFQENTLEDGFVKKWISRKDPVYDNGRPLGIIGFSIPIGLVSAKIQWESTTNRITLYRDKNNQIEFTNREFTVLQYCLKGATAVEIAEMENLSPKTIETYLMRIKQKFNCEKQRHLMAQLIQEDLAKDIMAFHFP